ncbi:MAG: amino acid permease, partial [Candidatus Coatesbacteria bacterium]
MTDGDGKIGFWAVFAIGVGGMVGGGIFAVLGLSVELAGGGTPVAFAVAGVVALITSYSYAKLSVTYPCQGGTVEFLNQAFGPGWVTGGLNTLLLLSYVVMLSLYSYAFGSYG